MTTLPHAFRAAIPALALALASGFGAPAAAQSGWLDAGARAAGIVLAQARQMSLRDIAAMIASQEPGRMSDAQLVNEGGRMVYLIRWEPSREGMRGRIIIFIVDAESGQILGRRGG